MRDFDWSILATLYNTRNITKASELLFITQPTLTRRLQQIEQEFDAALVIRTNKGISFTPEGEYAAQKALDILEIIDSVKSNIYSSKGELAGKLRLGAPNSFINFIIPALLENFSAMYPKVQIDLHTDLSHELLRYLEKTELDVSFVRGEHDTFLKKYHLSADQIYIFSKAPIDPVRLPELPQISYTKERSIVNASKRWWQERYDRPPFIRFRVHSGEACLALVKRGLGYAMFSDGRYYNPEDHLYVYPLKYLDGTSFSRNSWLVYNEDLAVNPVLSRFIDYVTENFTELFPPMNMSGEADL